MLEREGEEYRRLVEQTRRFLQMQMRGQLYSLPEKPKLPSPPVAMSPAHTTPPILAAEPLPAPLPREQPTPLVPSAIHTDAWSLQPMEEGIEDREFYTKLSAFLPLSMPPLSTLLILPEEIPAHRLFLETLSRVITQVYGSARVVSYYPQLFTTYAKSREVVRVITTAHFLRKKYPKAAPHQPLLVGQLYFIPTENIELYTREKEAKRALWKAIQLSFQS
jgi:hypothetical protein